MKIATKIAVDSIKHGDCVQFIWDDDLTGFGLRVQPSGAKVYIVQYRTAEGRTRRMTIGKHRDPWTPDKARQRAAKLLLEAAAGGDPASDRQAKRKKGNGPTIANLADKYMAEVAELTKKPRSVDEDRRNLEKYIRPALGRKLVTAVTKQDVQKLHHEMRDRPAVANRTRALLSHMYTKAAEFGMVEDGFNPVRGVKKYKEGKRERYLTVAELARLGDALAEAEETRAEPAAAIVAIRLLIFTACRRNEILTLKWDYVDFDAACLRLPESKTGAKIVHLSAPALEILQGIDQKDDNPYVLAGRKPRNHLIGLNHVWLRIRTKARLLDVRLHDLRHSYASVAVGLGEGLPIVGKMLGHSQAATTERYAHLHADPVKAATERVGAAIAGMMKGARGEVIDLPARRRK